MTEQQKCPVCHQLLIIDATHEYSIYQGEGDYWCKNTGDITYRCSSCGSIIKSSEIRGILGEVDEL